MDDSPLYRRDRDTPHAALDGSRQAHSIMAGPTTTARRTMQPPMPDKPECR